jgi:hypothetical protein
MAHYAFIDENNIVVKVITGVDENDTTNLPSEFSSWEEFYSDQEGLTCKRTSYNTINNTHLLDGTPFRGNYASKSGLYDTVNDVFLPEKIYDSWVVDETIWDYVAPVNKPAVNPEQYKWNEQAYQDDTANPKTEGWVLKPEHR